MKINGRHVDGCQTESKRKTQSQDGGNQQILSKILYTNAKERYYHKIAW